MILRESYSERRDGASLELLYIATFLPDAATLRGLLQSAGTLFTVMTPQGDIYGPLHKEKIELEGAPGAASPATARIRYRQDASDFLAPGTPVLIEASPAPGPIPSGTAAGAISLPLQSHHWTLTVTQAYAAPAWELHCTGTCDGQAATRTALLAGLGGAAESVPTPQFGVLDGLAKDEVAFEPEGADGSALVRLIWRGLPAADPDAFPQVEIVSTTGRNPGSCTLTKASRSAGPALSQELGQLLSYQGLFSGRIANIDRFVSSNGLYTASVTALDARWDMAGTIIGTAPLAAGSTSYARRGYEWIFNRHGMPDKDTSTAAFHDGDAAAYWTFGDILSHLSDAYMPASILGLPDWESLDRAGDIPGEIDLRGRDLATAIDMLLAQMGYTWTLRYGADSTASLHAFTNAGADGTVAIPLGSIVQNPEAAAHAGKAETIQDAWEQTEILSAPALCQCGFASAATGSVAGLAPLGQRPSDDADFAYEYRPDFSGISAWFPFLDNRTGAGYRLHPELAVRLADGATLNGYAPIRTSMEAVSPRLSVPAASHFWVTWNDLAGAWRRVVGGVSLRAFPAAVLVRRRIAVYSQGATQDRPKVEQVRPLDHAGFQIAGTLAFVSDHRLSSLAGEAGALPTPRIRTATRPELVPAYACAWIGDAFNPGDLNTFALFSPLTTLVDVQPQLDALAAAAQAGQASERVQSSAALAYWPAGIGAAIGKTLALDGAFFSGPEAIITGVTLRRDGKESCLLRATNQPVSAGQGRLAEAAAARNHFLKKLHS